MDEERNDVRSDEATHDLGDQGLSSRKELTSDSTSPGTGPVTRELIDDYERYVIGMNRDQRRRFIWLVKRRGENPDSARDSALETAPAKKKRKNKSLSPVQPVKKVKPVKIERKIGIASWNFPRDHLTNDNLGALEKSIETAILEHKIGEILPQFHNAARRKGWYAVNCANDETVEWVKSFVETCKPWKGAKLKVVETNDLPKPRVATAVLPKCGQNNDYEILEFLGQQNEGLNVRQWTVLSKNVPENTNTMIMTLLLDDISAKRLLKNSEVHIKMMKGSIKVRGKRGGNKLLKSRSNVDGGDAAQMAPTEPQPSTSSSRETMPYWRGATPRASARSEMREEEFRNTRMDRTVVSTEPTQHCTSGSSAQRPPHRSPYKSGTSEYRDSERYTSGSSAKRQWQRSSQNEPDMTEYRDLQRYGSAQGQWQRSSQDVPVTSEYREPRRYNSAASAQKQWRRSAEGMPPDTVEYRDPQRYASIQGQSQRSSQDEPVTSEYRDPRRYNPPTSAQKQWQTPSQETTSSEYRDEGTHSTGRSMSASRNPGGWSPHSNLPGRTDTSSWSKSRDHWRDRTRDDQRN